MGFKEDYDELGQPAEGKIVLAGAQGAADYKAALADLKAASKAHLSKIQNLNKRYEAAYKKGSSHGRNEKYDEIDLAYTSSAKAPPFGRRPC